jgi:hypothetical protein
MLVIPVLIEPAPLQARMKYYCCPVDSREVSLTVVGI